MARRFKNWRIPQRVNFLIKRYSNCSRRSLLSFLKTLLMLKIKAREMMAKNYRLWFKVKMKCRFPNSASVTWLLWTSDILITRYLCLPSMILKTMRALKCSWSISRWNALNIIEIISNKLLSSSLISLTVYFTTKRKHKVNF